MSLYKPGAKSPFYQFDFWLNGERFSGSTRCRTKPEAREVERQIRAEKEAEQRARRRSGSDPLTMDLAAERFWVERGDTYRGNARQTFKASLGWLVRKIGSDRLIKTIDDALVADLVALRRAEGVSNATVNRTVTEPLRRVLRRAADVWNQEVQKIKWKTHLLKEPKERIRELRDDEEDRLLAAFAPDYRVVVQFALLSGCRLAECVGLKWQDVDWGNRQIIVRGKGETVEPIPLTTAMRELLWPLQGHHRERVFTYATASYRLPISYEGMKTAWRRARAKAGVQDFRFHDNRHTAATRLMRAGASIKTVQKLLRHSDIATTSKYAHVTMDDVREAMERAAEARIPENVEAGPVKSTGASK